MNVETVVKWVAVALIIIGALNWGLVGAFHFNAVTALFGDMTIVTRVIYILVGVAGLYKLFLIVAKKM